MKRVYLAAVLLAGVSVLGASLAAGDRQNQQGASLSLPGQSQANEIPNELIDLPEFLDSVDRSAKLRAEQRLTEDSFIRLSREKGVVVLDARSKNRYEELHIEGAISLPFTDFTADSLAELIPSKETKVLIYCNNNFRGNLPELATKSIGAALNLSTFASLVEYGYENVYELGPALDVDKTKITFVGTNSAKYSAENGRRIVAGTAQVPAK